VVPCGKTMDKKPIRFAFELSVGPKQCSLNFGRTYSSACKRMPSLALSSLTLVRTEGARACTCMSALSSLSLSHTRILTLDNPPSLVIDFSVGRGSCDKSSCENILKHNGVHSMVTQRIANRVPQHTHRDFNKQQRQMRYLVGGVWRRHFQQPYEHSWEFQTQAPLKIRKQATITFLFILIMHTCPRGRHMVVPYSPHSNSTGRCGRPPLMCDRAG